MKTISINLFLATICFLLIACELDPDKAAIEDCFTSIQTLALEGNEAAIATKITKDSKEFLEKVYQISKTPHSPDAKERFIRQQRFPICTRLIFAKLEQIDSTSYNEEIPIVNNMIYFLGKLRFGVTHPERSLNYAFKEVLGIDGNYALVAIRQQVDTNTFISSKVDFFKEEGAWKMDLMMTYSFYEKFLKQQYRKKGGNMDAFIQDYLAGDGTGEFRYRSKR